MRKAILDRISRLLDQQLAWVCIVLAVVLGAATYAASRLKINSNQLDLLPQDMRAVKEAHRVQEMIGGIGHLIISLKSNDEKHLKAVADDLANKLQAMPEIRDVRHKVDTSFVRKHIALYVETPDLEEIQRRLKAKIKDVVRRANPFHFTLRKSEPVKLDLADLIEKYKRLGKKGIADDYYITPDKKMTLLVVKPMGQPTDLEFTRKLCSKLQRFFEDYGRSNTLGAVLKEGYQGRAPGATVTYGFTGHYKLSLDDSDSILQSLVPTSAVSLGGILILLLIFLRRLSLVIALTLSLVVGVILTFGYTFVAVGELNSITAILGGILMGQGIDFGIHFIYRLREEYAQSNDIQCAFREAIAHSGAAAVTTATTTAAAFFVLAISDFHGFRDFGIIAGGGTFIIAFCMYFVTATLLRVLSRIAPSFTDRVLRLSRKETARAERNETHKAPFPWARPLVWGLLTLTGLLIVTGTGRPAVLGQHLPQRFTRGARFDYDSRSLMVKDRPSIVLQAEIKERFKISSDPVAVYTPTLDATKQLYGSMVPLDPKKYDMVDAVIGLFTFLPPAKQQQDNAKILARIKADLAPIKPNMLEEKLRGPYQQILPLLDAKPFALDDIPEIYRKEFREVPQSREKGYLTFIYPNVALWDSRDLMRFSDQVSEIKVGENTYYATGLAILFARLATIVLRDGKIFTALAAVLILVIILIDLRSLVGALLALLPLIAGVGWMLGLMALIDQPINFMNVVVFPVVLGYGIGNGIYLYHRYKESGSVRVALSQTGRAVLASSTTTLVGWGALLTANHRGLESMGIIASIGIGCVLFTSLTLLPAAMQLVSTWGARLSRKQIAP
jgi:predicted RND superfamily exporter protein